MQSSQHYGLRYIFTLFICVFIVMLLASLDWISETSILPILLLLWGANGLYHGILLRKSIPLKWTEIPIRRAFSFQDKQSILGMIVPSLFILGFVGYLLLTPAL